MNLNIIEKHKINLIYFLLQFGHIQFRIIVVKEIEKYVLKWIGNYIQIMSTQNSKYRTILTDEPSPSEPGPNHPLFYCNHRSSYLKNLSDRYATEFRVSKMDLRKNARVDYYMGQYAQKQQQIKRQEAIKKSYLNADSFQSVFCDQIDENRARERERKQQERLRHNLQQLYRQEEEEHQEAEHDRSTDQEEPATVLRDYRSDPNKQKQLYLLDLQIGRLTLEQKIEKKVQDRRQMCTNERLLSRMSSNILSAYMVNFDEIYNSLIDEILAEQVYYLNYLQADYKVEKEEQGSNSEGHRIAFNNVKAIQMLQLVKQLDQLCDD